MCERKLRRWKALFLHLVPTSVLATFHRRVYLFALFCRTSDIRSLLLHLFLLLLTCSGMGCQGAKDQPCVCPGGANSVKRPFSSSEDEQDCLMSQLFYFACIIQRRRREEKISRCGGGKTCCFGQGLGEKRAGSLASCPWQTFTR